MYPISAPLPDRSVLNSAAVSVKGCWTKASRCGLLGPEYALLGTIVALPAVSILVKRHGPSTTCQSGSFAYSDSFLERPSRNLKTALAPDAVWSKSPTFPVTDVLSHVCCGIGVICDSWL